MNAPAVAFLSPELFAQTDESLWRQAFESASYEGVKGMYMLPDTHLGYGIPVGGVVVTENTIIQSGSGYDVSCGVVYMEVPGLTAQHIADPESRRRWIREVESRIGTGVGAGPASQMRMPNHRTMQDILRNGAAALGVPADKCERQYIEIDEREFTGNHATRQSPQIRKALDKCAHQLGSVGGGNHFVEMQVDRDTG
jgi:tRNA-splicing ligase RtcB